MSGDEECSDACTRLVCEWCPEYDRQAQIVAEFRDAMDAEVDEGQR